ncbi:hypothetical protein [Haloarcula halophila]|uniref:hypothetical protein n=1 Tax=Haloarcula TaxID=2237 RepID=UPI0023E3E3C7|nr:hypothetical protein [Halomicroarcula sp. DFY41]
MVSDDDTKTVNRRTLLWTAATLSVAGLAGRSTSTPFGDLDASGGGDGGTTQTPAPVTRTVSVVDGVGVAHRFLWPRLCWLLSR